MRTKPSFIIVTLVLTLMTIFSMGMHFMVGKLPPPPPNRLSAETADFLQQGAGERVNWYPYGEIAFAEARRQDKPVLLAVGAPYSRFGRDLDRYVLSAKEVVNYLNRNFICVRVDLMEQPDWLNNYLPISRFQSINGGPPQLFFTSGLQFWILDSQGRMYDLIARVAASQKIDRSQMVQLLSNARDQFAALRKGAPNAPDPGANQRHDLEVLQRQVTEAPNIPAVLTTLDATIDPVYGGFPSNGFQVPQPQALKLLLLTGRLHSFEHAAMPMLHTPIYDLLDGGFFRQSRGLDWSLVDFDKLAIPNAELAEDFASAYAMTGSGEYKFVASQTLQSLTTEFLQGTDFAGCRMGDDVPMNRSQRSSFPPIKLHDAVGDRALRDWAYEALILDPRLNRQCVPIFNGDVSQQHLEKQNRVLDLFRAFSKEPPKFAAKGYANINAGVLARLIPTARLLNDRSKLDQLLMLFDSLPRFKSNDDIVHLATGKMPEANYLVDYLTYADASLQAFLATGRLVYFQDGLAVLKRAIFLFHGNVPGEFFLAQRDADKLGPADIKAPEVIDNVGESCTAKIIRLCLSYQYLVDPTKDSSSADSLLETASRAARQYGGIANELGIHSSGMFCAAAMLQDDTHAIAVGPNSQALSDQLFRLTPQHFVGQAFGPLRPDLQKRAPGIYIVRGDDVKGPFDAGQAAVTLGSSLLVQ